MTSQARKDALVRELHDIGSVNECEVSVTIIEGDPDTHFAVAEFLDPTIKEVVIAQATTNTDGIVTIEEVWLTDDALELVGHAVLRALGRKP